MEERPPWLSFIPHVLRGSNSGATPVVGQGTAAHHREEPDLTEAVLPEPLDDASDEREPRDDIKQTAPAPPKIDVSRWDSILQDSLEWVTEQVLHFECSDADITEVREK